MKQISQSILFVGTIIVGAFSVSAQQPEMPPAQVQVALAEQRQLAPQIDVSGTVISLNDSRISTEVEGPLTSIAPVGTFVKKGEVIAAIDDRLLAIAHRRAEAALKRLEADMVFRTEDVKRFKDLAARDNASKSRLQEVIAQREMIAQDIEDAKAQMERTKGDLNRARIKAPFAGTIVERLANTGEYLTVGANIVRLVDTQDLEIAIPAPIAVIPFMTKGMSVSVRSGDTQHMLPIRTVVPVGDIVSRMVEVRLSASDAGWIIGTPVTVSLPKAKAQIGVAVPRDAVVLRGGSMFFYKVNSQGIAEQIPADLREAVGLWVPVSTGVAAGDQIVIRGAERLQPGQKVIISNPG
jgi:RND family efflux transporter MFP subunit